VLRLSETSPRFSIQLSAAQMYAKPIVVLRFEEHEKAKAPFCGPRSISLKPLIDTHSYCNFTKTCSDALQTLNG